MIRTLVLRFSHIHLCKNPPESKLRGISLFFSFLFRNPLLFIRHILKEVKICIPLMQQPVCAGQSHEGSGEFAVFAVFIREFCRVKGFSDISLLFQSVSEKARLPRSSGKPGKCRPDMFREQHHLFLSQNFHERIICFMPVQDPSSLSHISVSSSSSPHAISASRFSYEIIRTLEATGVHFRTSVDPGSFWSISAPRQQRYRKNSQ